MRRDLSDVNKEIKNMVKTVQKNFIDFVSERISTPPNTTLNIDPSCKNFIFETSYRVRIW